MLDILHNYFTEARLRLNLFYNRLTIVIIKVSIAPSLRLSEPSPHSFRYGETLVKLASLSEDGQFISLITNIIGGVKSWGLAKITFEDDKFVHAVCGTCFSFEGAEKRHCEMTGKVWEGGDSIDDYC